jgi:signal transduction histidine kinase
VAAEGPAPIVATVVRNLVGNALAHGDGQVTVRLLRGELVVENRAPSGRDGEHAGFGFGLSIVEDLCARFGWTLELVIEDAARARVRFDRAALDRPGADDPPTEGPQGGRAR